jgi:hypothetical protein
MCLSIVLTGLNFRRVRLPSLSLSGMSYDDDKRWCSCYITTYFLLHSYNCLCNFNFQFCWRLQIKRWSLILNEPLEMARYNNNRRCFRPLHRRDAGHNKQTMGDPIMLLIHMQLANNAPLPLSMPKYVLSVLSSEAAHEKTLHLHTRNCWQMKRFSR